MQQDVNSEQNSLVVATPEKIEDEDADDFTDSDETGLSEDDLEDDEDGKVADNY